PEEEKPEEEKPEEEKPEEEKPEEEKPEEEKPEEEKPEEEKPEEEKPEEEEKDFVKGEIANIGAKRIVAPYNLVGVGIGPTRIAHDYYLTLNPKFDIKHRPWEFISSFHLPFNIKMFSTDFSGEQNENFSLRKKDWDEWHDYLRIIKYLQFGRSEDNFFLSVGSNFAQTIGHGTILKRYIPDFNPSFHTLSVKLNWYNKYGGFETLLGDVATGNIFGGIAFFKPLSFFLDDYRSQSLSFGYTFVADHSAPSKMKYENYADMPDPYSPEWDDSIPRRLSSDHMDRPVVLSDEFIYSQGIDVEFKWFKNEKVDIKTYADYSWFNDTPEIGGFAFGALGRFNMGEDRSHAMRAQLEMRVYDDRYIPSFFDMFYAIERYEMVTNINGKNNFTPDGRSKYFHLTNRDESKKIFGVYSELTYSYINKFSASLGFEKLNKSFSLYGHMELPDLWIFKGTLTYFQRGITDFNSIFKDSDISSALRSAVRIKILPILYINAYVSKHWSFWPPEKLRRDDDLHGHFLSVWEAGFDVEIGYEWGKKNKKDQSDAEKESEKEEDEFIK
ncbi:MAG: hypothetical protein R6W70_05405, partial [bacterium]